jgi:hypothetical protein
MLREQQTGNIFKSSKLGTTIWFGQHYARQTPLHIDEVRKLDQAVYIEERLQYGLKMLFQPLINHNQHEHEDSRQPVRVPQWHRCPDSISTIPFHITASTDNAQPQAGHKLDPKERNQNWH